MKQKSKLTDVEIRTILRAADEIIGKAGRTLLVKILKGSKEQKIRELGLDQCPCYGAFREQTKEEILLKVDWMIQHDFLEIQVNGKLPMLVFTEKGWRIERDQMVDELLEEWNRWLEQGVRPASMEYLKDRNRGMILLFLQKIKESNDSRYVPFLRAWQAIEYRKVRQAIQDVIECLEEGTGSSLSTAAERKAELAQALQAKQLEPEYLKCWECGERFSFDVDEQKFYKLRGFVPPKRCPACRERKWLREMGIDDD